MVVKGERYSKLYLQRGVPLPDSTRVRTRLGHYIVDFGYATCEEFRKVFIRELGVSGKRAFSGEGWMGYFFAEAEMRDVLDVVTLIYEEFTDPTHWDRELASEWREFAVRVFKEENLAFTIDEHCGVHPLIDPEFERNIASAIAGLGEKRYQAARTAFEAAQSKLEQTEPDTKGAIRDVFEAAETLTKLIAGSGKALTAAFVKAELEPKVQRLYASDSVATMVGTRMAQSFADWVDAAHPYRHGQKSEEPVRPPDELAVLLVSQGASFLRWLVDLDRQLST